MAVEYLDKGNDDGTTLGQSASSLISLWGATPVDQPAAVTVTGGVSAPSTANVTAMSIAIDAIIARLIEAGIIAAA